MFKQYSEKVNYPEIDKKILEFWKEKQVFEKSISTREGKEPFTFYEGPPTANGKPGIHHVMARALKDLICRYKTLKGYQVHRKAGWDTHGLPVEIEVEKALGIKNKSEIPEFGVDKYNKACRDSVFTYKGMWEEMTERMGYWVDLEDAYVTCTNEYIESVWWSLKTLFDKGLIFKDYKIVPQCPRSETVLSSHELALGYKDTKDPSVYVKFKIEDEKIKSNDKTYFLVWTTTPWTLISNVGLAVGPDVDYVKIKIEDEYLILAEARLEVIKEEYEIIEKFKGSDFKGVKYEQLFKYVKVDKEAWFVILADFVSTEDGSGIVHIAPAFGADDYEICKVNNLPFTQPVNRRGEFTDEVPDLEGKFVKDADQDIIYMLKQTNQLYRKETIVHSYPFSWRFDDVPVIYYARESWFIKTTQIADKMVQLNKEINWCPPEVGSGRFGNWLEDNKDWALSRDRFWATPLPIWVTEDGSDMIAVGSIEDLKQGFVERDGQRINVADLPAEEIDLHKPFVDDVKFEKDGKLFTRTPELIDVWYDSGAMPFAQYHYPFENKELFEKRYPADFICEGIDQTRGWFYTMHAIGTMLFDSVTYKNLIVNELILDKNGAKMSKSKGNTVNPFELFDKYGADATRWYLVTSSPPWRPTLFDEEGIVEVQRKFFGTLMNTYNFFAMYANIDKFDFSADLIPYEKRPEIDRWIISKVSSLVKNYEVLMDAYDPTRAARAVSEFTNDHLSNWYVRRCRRRFWKSEINENKISAYQTLYECLDIIAKLSAPFAPFVAEEIFQNLNRTTKRDDSVSVHLVDFPKPLYVEDELEEKMDIAQRVVFLSRSMRAKANLKVRQPLAKIMIAIDQSKREAVEAMKDVILEEVNIKELVVLEDDSNIVNKSAKPNFKVIGPKFGKLVKGVAAAIKELDKDAVAAIEADGKYSINVNDEDVEITLDDVEIVSTEIEGWVVETEEGITVAIDSELTDDLVAEGFAREFVNRVQNMRKDFGLELMDRIKIGFNSDNKLAESIKTYADYITTETLAVDISAEQLYDAYKQDWKVGEYDCTISIDKAE